MELRGSASPPSPLEAELEALRRAIAQLTASRAPQPRADDGAGADAASAALARRLAAASAALHRADAELATAPAGGADAAPDTWTGVMTGCGVCNADGVGPAVALALT